MIYFIYEIFLLLFFVAEFPIANANELYDYEHLFLEFVKDPNNFEQLCKDKGFDDENGKIIANYERKYVANFGVVFLLKKNWNCAIIGDKFTEKEEKERCEKYRQYLGILYEYFFRVFSGLPAVKPMFYYQQIYTLCTMTETVESLAMISKFYFNSKVGKRNGHKLETFFMHNCELKLFNKSKLKYAANLEKETFQETVVRMGFDLKWENEIRENHLNLIRPKFDGILEGMFKKAEKSVESEESKELSSKRDSSANYIINFNEYNIRRLLYPFYIENTFDDVAIIPFMKGQSNFEQFCNALDKEKCMELSDEFEKYLPVLYLMRRNWHCAKIGEENEAEKELRLICEKYRNYVHLIYEYLFIVYATEQRLLAKQMPAIRPIFEDIDHEILSIIKTVKSLHSRSYTIFGKKTAEKTIELLNYFYYNYYVHLINENKSRNYLANFGNWNKIIREEFDKKLNRMLKKDREDAKMYKMKRNHDLCTSPFYEKVYKVENKVFIAFLRGQLYFEHVCEKYQYNLSGLRHRLTMNETLEQNKEHFTQKYEAHLGVVYLMRQKWKCDENGKELGENERKECQKYRKYLNIFYEYLLNVDSEDDDPVKAINSQLLIEKVEETKWTLIDVVKCFNEISKSYFKSEFRQTIKYQLENVENSNISIQKIEQIFKSEKESEEKKEEKQKKFDEKLKKMLQKAEENGKGEEAKIKMMGKKERANALTKELREEKDAHNDKFGTLFDSPFYGTVPNEL